MANENSLDGLLSETGGAEALDGLVEQLNLDKDKTIYNFLSNPGSEDVLWALIHMLSSKTIRIASNAAYVIGSLAETELGSHRILSFTQGKSKLRILEDLTHMLAVEDAETVMNAAGTLGTLAETEEGRHWMLSQPCIEDTMTSVTFLLGSDNHWTASNSALVLARVTISDTGSQAILNHPRSKYILTRLAQSLGNDSAGRGMNAAFAVGRLLDTKVGKERLLNCPETEKMITSLCRMLSKGDMGSAKNACFALSCLATDSDGNQRVLVNSLFQEVLARLILLLGNSEDTEAAWFAAMTIKTISSHKHGVIKLRQNNEVESALLRTKDKPRNSKELNEEIEKALMHLKKLDQPEPPNVSILSSTSAKVIWKPENTASGLQISYKLYCDNKIVYKGQDCERIVNDLQPFTSYSFKLRASTLGDDSPYSDTVSITTDEDVPSPPTFLRVLGAMPTQLRLTWNAPEHHNGILRGYSVFVGDKLVDTVNDMAYILTRLSPATHYSVHVCAVTSKGMGQKSTVEAVTEELGAHAPEKPIVTVIGRNEVHVAWMPPSVPLGRFFRYELCMNDRVVYQGTDKVFRATGLTPDTDYVFVVVAITSEGRCVSEPTKKRTLKDKVQNEPGHHQLKTHSFMAKEFQVMQEKSKSQPSIVTSNSKLKQRSKKRLSNRPSSTVSTSNASDASALTEGTWALDVTDSCGNEEKKEGFQGENAVRKSGRRIQNAAILGGVPIKKKTPPHPVSTPKAQQKTEIISHAHNGEAQSDGSTLLLEGNANTMVKQDVVLVKKVENSQPYSAEVFLDKENNEQRKMTSRITRSKGRYHRAHTIMKGKKVLKSDKEILAEMASANSHHERSGSKQHEPPETGYSVRPFYPDIVSTIRNPHGSEKTLENDLINGKLLRKSLSSPDSLDAEPGTARLGDETVEYFGPKSEIPLIKSSFPHHIIRERHINYNQMKQHSKRNSYPQRSLRSYAVSKSDQHNPQRGQDHVILKSNPASKFGLKYTHNHVSNISEGTMDNDSAFQSLSAIHSTSDVHSQPSYLQKPLYLQPLKSGTLMKVSSERNLNGDVPEPKTLSSRLKTPPKGYWSDHDVSPPRGKKKAPVLTPINYKTFQGAHRPTKSIRLESPLVTNSDHGTWFVGDSAPGSDNNQYKFIPTQWRTQPVNLPTHGKSAGRLNYRLESLNDANRSKLEVQDINARGHSTTPGGHTQSPPARKRLIHPPNQRRIPKSTQDALEPESTRVYMRPLGLLSSKENSVPSVHKLKAGSLASLNYHHGFEMLSHHGSHSPRLSATKLLPSATPTNVPHTMLSPLSASDSSPSASKSSPNQDDSPKSPRLRMTSTSSFYGSSSIPRASGYAISPSNSLSPLLSGDKNIAQMQCQMALVPGGGDAV